MNIITPAKSFFLKCKRVWMALRKPTKDEYVQVIKISGLGILAIGLVGFIIGIVIGFVR